MQARKIFGTSDQNHGLTPFKICKCFVYSKMSFLWSKKPRFKKTTSSNDNTNASFTEKQARKIFRTSDQNHGLTSFKIFKFFDYRKISFLSSKKARFEKTTSSNDKTNVSFTEKQARNIFGTSDQNYWLTTFKICKFFDYSKMSFLWFKKPPFEKTTSSNDKTNVSFTEKQARNIFGTSDQNHQLTHLKIWKFLDYSKMSFLWSKKAPFEKTTLSNDKTNVSFTEKQFGKIFETFDQKQEFGKMEIFQLQ